MEQDDDLQVLSGLITITFAAPFGASVIIGRIFHPQSQWLSILNCFAAGIFISITFFHILGESIEKTTSLFESTQRDVMIKYVCGFFLLGFVIMLWLDKIWFSRYHSHSHHEGLLHPNALYSL
jgi:zinc transporter ZupT